MAAAQNRQLETYTECVCSIIDIMRADDDLFITSILAADEAFFTRTGINYTLCRLLDVLCITYVGL